MIRLWDWVLRFIGGDWDHWDHLKSCQNVPDESDYRHLCDDADGCTCDAGQSDEFVWESAVAADWPE